MKHEIFTWAAVLSLSLSLSLITLACCVTPAQAVRTWITGRASWWAVGDTLQMDGDCATASPLICLECEAWQSDDCTQIDTCLRFRKVTGVDIQDCSFGSAGPVMGSMVLACFWIGATAFEALCTENEDPSCPFNNYCESLWEVVSFNSVGDDVVGCYQLELLCEGDDPECAQGAPTQRACP